MSPDLRKLADEFLKLAQCNSRRSGLHLTKPLDEALTEETTFHDLQQAHPALGLNEKESLMEVQDRWINELHQRGNPEVQKQLLLLYRWIFDNKGKFDWIPWKKTPGSC